MVYASASRSQRERDASNGAIDVEMSANRKLSASVLSTTMVPPCGHKGSAANCPAPDHTTADISTAPTGDKPTVAVLAPKMAPNAMTLGANGSASMKPPRKRPY